MRTCPQCNGKKVITVSVCEISPGKKDQHSEFETECLTCKGKGAITDAAFKADQKARNAWCRCGNKSGEVRFYDDGQHPECSKHHWRCADCEKILQVG